MGSMGDVLFRIKLPRYAHFAKLYEAHGRYAEADDAYQMLGEGLKRTQGPEHADVGTALYQLARLNAEHEFEHSPQTEEQYRKMNRFLWVQLFYQTALDIRTKALEPTHPDLAESQYGLALYLWRCGDQKGAASLLQQAINIQRAALGDHRDLTLSLNALARIQHQLADPRGALQSFTAALEVHRRAAQKQPLVDEAARLTAEAGTLLETEDGFVRGVAVLRRVLEIQQAQMRDAYFEMAYRIIGEPDSGPQVVAGVLDLHRTLFVKESRLALIETLNGLADIHNSLGDSQSALPYLKEALEVQRSLA
jgi:tetratricopeptide (TPR) repeat protein